MKTGFYSALAIGVMAILIIFNPSWYKFFVPLYVVFYSFMVIWFVNYYHRMKFVIPVIASVPQDANVCAVSAETVASEIKKEEAAEETTDAVMMTGAKAKAAAGALACKHDLAAEVAE